jgi:hypothetical protein
MACGLGVAVQALGMMLDLDGICSAFNLISKEYHCICISMA